MTDDGVTVGWTLRERSVREFARDLRVSEAHLRVVLAQHGTPVVEKPRKARREPRPAPAVRRHPVASMRRRWRGSCGTSTGWTRRAEITRSAY